MSFVSAWSLSRTTFFRSPVEGSTSTFLFCDVVTSSSGTTASSCFFAGATTCGTATVVLFCLWDCDCITTSVRGGVNRFFLFSVPRTRFCLSSGCTTLLSSGCSSFFSGGVTCCGTVETDCNAFGGFFLVVITNPIATPASSKNKGTNAGFIYFFKISFLLFFVLRCTKVFMYISLMSSRDCVYLVSSLVSSDSWMSMGE